MKVTWTVATVLERIRAIDAAPAGRVRDHMWLLFYQDLLEALHYREFPGEPGEVCIPDREITGLILNRWWVDRAAAPPASEDVAHAGSQHGPESLPGD